MMMMMVPSRLVRCKSGEVVNGWIPAGSDLVSTSTKAQAQ
jgi:hypothetical protein